MKGLLFYLVTLIFFGCHDEVSIKTELDLKQANSEIIKINQMDKNLSFVESNLCNTIANDTIQVIVEITNMLPIDWGTKYKCKIIKTIKGSIACIDSILNFEIGLIKTNDIIETEVHQKKQGKKACNLLICNGLQTIFCLKNLSYN